MYNIHKKMTKNIFNLLHFEEISGKNYNELICCKTQGEHCDVCRELYILKKTGKNRTNSFCDWCKEKESSFPRTFIIFDKQDDKFIFCYEKKFWFCSCECQKKLHDNVHNEFMRNIDFYHCYNCLDTYNCSVCRNYCFGHFYCSKECTEILLCKLQKISPMKKRIKFKKKKEYTDYS